MASKKNKYKKNRKKKKDKLKKRPSFIKKLSRLYSHKKAMVKHFKKIIVILGSFFEEAA